MVAIKSIEEFLDNLPKDPCPEILGEPYCSICRRINRTVAERCRVRSGISAAERKNIPESEGPGVLSPTQPQPAPAIAPKIRAKKTVGMEIRPEEMVLLPEKDAPLIEFIPPPAPQKRIHVRVIAPGTVKKEEEVAVEEKEVAERLEKEKIVAQRPPVKKKIRPVRRPVEEKREGIKKGEMPEEEVSGSVAEGEKPVAQEIADKLIEEVFEATTPEEAEPFSEKEATPEPPTLGEKRETIRKPTKHEIVRPKPILEKKEEKEEKKIPVSESPGEEKAEAKAPRPVKKPLLLKKPVKKAVTPSTPLTPPGTPAPEAEQQLPTLEPAKKEVKRPLKKALLPKVEKAEKETEPEEPVKPEAPAEEKKERPEETEKKEEHPEPEEEKKKRGGFGLFKKRKEKPVLALVPEKELEKPTADEEERKGPVVEAEAKPTPSSVKKGWEPIKKPKKKEDLLKKK